MVRTGRNTEVQTPGPPAGAYPADLEHDVVLRDGTSVRIRPIRPDDAPRLVALHERLSAHTAYQRFFTVMRRLPPDWARFLATVDYASRLALVAERGTAGEPELIAVARYEPDPAGVAELAIVVQDGWQGKGLGVVLLEDLLAAAEARGIRRLRAWVLADNTRMLRLLARLTRIESRHTEAGVTEVVFTRRAGAGSSPPGPASRGARAP
jgi:RimJ/RimL family protein N-acetyltransferase